MRLRGVTLALMLCAAGAARAADWRVLMFDTETVAFGEKASMTQTPEGKRLWMDAYYRTGDLWHIMALYDFDCSGRRLKILTSKRYDRANRETLAEGPSDWDYVWPSSRGESALNFACQNGDGLFAIDDGTDLSVAAKDLLAMANKQK